MLPMSMICYHAIVSGRVQGVFYRAHTQQKAQELGLTGWVRNCTDGTVELMACGETLQIKKLADWLKIGPPHASVQSIEAKEQLYQVYEGFAIR